MLQTAFFGSIRVVSVRPSIFDTFIDFDLIGEWEYWQLVSGEIVAYPVEEE